MVLTADREIDWVLWLKVSLDFTILVRLAAHSTVQTAGPAEENAHSANLVQVRGLMKMLLSEKHWLEWLTVSLTCCTSSRR